MNNDNNKAILCFHGVAVSSNVSLTATNLRSLAIFTDVSVRRRLHEFTNHTDFIDRVTADINKVYGKETMYSVVTYDCEMDDFIDEFHSGTHFQILVDVVDHGFNTFSKH